MAKPRMKNIKFIIFKIHFIQLADVESAIFRKLENRISSFEKHVFDTLANSESASEFNKNVSFSKICFSQFLELLAITRF